jgi:hypothetical protein
MELYWNLSCSQEVVVRWTAFETLTIEMAWRHRGRFPLSLAGANLLIGTLLC